MNQDRTHISNICSRTLHQIFFSFCLIYSAGILAQQNQNVEIPQNPTLYEYSIPYASQDGSLPYYNSGQDIAEPPPGPYQALPDDYPYVEPLQSSGQQGYSMPPISPVQGAGPQYDMQAAPPAPVDNSTYAYPQYPPPPPAPEIQQGSHGAYTNPPQYRGQGQMQSYPGYGGGNHGDYRPPAFGYPPVGGYQQRAPQGNYQGQQGGTYPPSGYANPYSYPQGSSVPGYPNRYSGQ